MLDNDALLDVARLILWCRIGARTTGTDRI